MGTHVGDNGPRRAVALVHLPAQLRPVRRERDRGRDVRHHDDEHNEREGRAKERQEDDERDRDVEQDRCDVEQDDLEQVGERVAAVERPQRLPRLALGLPGERQLEKVVEAQLLQGKEFLRSAGERLQASQATTTRVRTCIFASLYCSTGSHVADCSADRPPDPLRKRAPT